MSFKGLLAKQLTRPIRLPRFKPYTPHAQDPSIFWFNSERTDIIRDVVTRVAERTMKNDGQLEYLLNECAYEEVKRLELQKNEESKLHLPKWRGIIRKLSKLSQQEKKALLATISQEMAEDVAGNFDPRVYQLTTKAVPHLLTGIMNPSALPQELRMDRMLLGKHVIDDVMQTAGPVEHLRRLSKIGTLVFVPTHSSNLDSVALGYALIKERLPPVVYGAGKNLFTNPIVSFFMHNLGAYRVDRRIRATLYKDILKTYSCVLLERGYHSLFFPGGTRSRSGLVEQHLKLGLAGTIVEAYARNTMMGIKRPYFIVPTTINYGLVLEAESLIEDYLKESGRARFIIEDDEFSEIDRWVSFFRRIFGTDAACVIRFGDPIDPFGNRIDEEGRSVSPSGKIIDPSQYFYSNGKPTLDAARDAAFTKELGEEIPKHYDRHTVIMGSQLVAHGLYKALIKQTPGADVYGRMRHRGDVSVERTVLATSLGIMRDKLREMEKEGKVFISPFLHAATPDQMIDRVLLVWNGYHKKYPATQQGNHLVIEDPTTILYYQNRLLRYAEAIAEPDELSWINEAMR